MLSQNSTSLTVAENQLATSIGLAAPVDTVYSGCKFDRHRDDASVQRNHTAGRWHHAGKFGTVPDGHSVGGVEVQTSTQQLRYVFKFRIYRVRPRRLIGCWFGSAHDRSGDHAGVDELEVANRTAECRSDVDRHRGADRRKLFRPHLSARKSLHCPRMGQCSCRTERPPSP